MDHRSNHTGASRNRHTHEILPAGTSGVGRLRVDLDVEARQTSGSRHQENERGDRAKLHYLVAQLEVIHGGKSAKPPEPGEDRRGNPEGDDVGQGIEFASKRAGGVGEPRDSSVEPIEQDGEADRLGGLVKMPRIACRALDGLRYSVVPCSNVRRREYRRQDVQALSGWARIRARGAGRRRLVAHLASAVSCNLDVTECA